MKIRVAIFLLVMTLHAGFAFSQWTPVSSTGTTFILYGMSFPPGQSTVGYACGMQYTYDADGVIVKTVDGGDNWTQIWPTSGTIDGLQGIWFISELVGFACGWNNYFIKTTDGGVTWNPVTVGTGVWYYRDVEFWDASNGIAVAVMNNSNDQAAFITSNGGNTWVPATSGMATADVMGISYASSSIVYAAGTSANVYKSTDGGHNWSVINTLSAMLFGLDFHDTNFGVVGGEEKMFATNDGGNTWSTYTTGYENFYGALALEGGTAYIGGTDERIHKTTNYGQNWILDNAGTTSSLYRIRKTANGTLFACGSQGYILKWVPPLEADFTATPTTICSGSNVNFFDNSTGAIDSWEWTFEGGTPAVSYDENPVVTYNTPGIYDVELTVTAGGNSSTELKTDYIEVYGALVAPDTPDGPAEVCGTYSYQYITGNVLYAETYHWVVIPADAGTITGNGTVGTFTASNNWSGVYTIKVRAENQCGDGPWSTEFSANLYHDPVVFDLIGDGTYCEGEDGAEIILSDSEEGVNYELFIGQVSTGVTIAGTGEEMSFGYFTETGLYTATGFTDHCSETMVGQIYVQMQFLPDQAGIPEGPESVCAEATSSYSSIGANNATDYTWMLDPEEAGTISPDGESCTISWSASFSGTANLNITGLNDCGTGTPSAELTITVNPSPQPLILGPGLVCDNEEEIYYTAENSGSEYSWEVTGGTITSGAGTWQITVMWGDPGPGSVTVTETTTAGCENTSQELYVTIDDCAGIGENAIREINIYPNPASDNLNITGLSDAKVKIYNLLGVEIYSAGKLNGLKIINLSSFREGIYLVKVEQGEKIETFQLIKQ